MAKKSSFYAPSDIEKGKFELEKSVLTLKNEFEIVLKTACNNDMLILNHYLDVKRQK